VHSEVNLADARQRADTGNPGAYFLLGNSYRLGYGVAVDDKQAAKWYRLAATAVAPQYPQSSKDVTPSHVPAVVKPGAQDDSKTLLLETKRQQSVDCLSNILVTPDAKLLSGKVLLDPSAKPTLALLADKSKVNPKEQAALSDVVAEWERCLDIGADWRKQNYPVIINSMFDSYWVDLKSIFADLYGKNLTFGEVAKARAKLDVEFKNNFENVFADLQQKKMAEEKQRLEADSQRRYAEARNQQEREAESQRQRVAQQQLEQQQAQLRLLQKQQREAESAAAFSNGLMLLQAAQPKFRPMITCNTDKFGNGLQTTCN
jgi:hypothetical protein